MLGVAARLGTVGLAAPLQLPDGLEPGTEQSSAVPDTGIDGPAPPIAPETIRRDPDGRAML